MKTTGAVVGLVATGPLLLAAPLVVVAAKDAAACTASSPQAVDSAAVARQVESILNGGKGDSVSTAGLSNPAEQIPNAKTIVATGIALKVPTRGQVVALATALQESGLRNLSYGDRDSLGLFQQRPSQGWGTAEQIQDPVYAATQFYTHLLKVDGWQQLTVTQAAQEVQRSGYPGAYAKWEDLATALQSAIAKALGSADDAGESTDTPTAAAGSSGCAAEGGEDGAGFGTIPAGALPDGYEIPADAPAKVRTAIRWALGQLGTPYQWGGSCTDSHGQDPMGRCDCSSLMQRSYAAAGVTLSRTTYTQVKEGKAVSLGAVKPGDLLFTEGTAAAPDHVGMYIGSGLIVHAPRTGDVVRITTLAAWKSQVLAVRRIVA
ncbi:C40 family peptidase [Streptomyces cinereospinus]|uniref:C40 family peptidase n=1 Tax=Streptomyces cinereospinus TaxID=285561 RepID=A0ABV5N3U2_9ACTN